VASITSVSYTAGECLGKGASATVNKGTVEGYEGDFALKIFHSGRDIGARRERKIYESQIQHESLLGFFGSIGTTKNPVLLLELFPHQSLYNQYGKKGRKMSLDRAREVFLRVGRGYKYLHGEGVIHGDVKSDNILCSDAGEVKIIDMNVAHKDGVTGLLKEVMAVPYRSPELVHGLRYTNTVDVWALACCVHDLITGKLLFDVGVDCSQFTHCDAKQLSIQHQNAIGSAPPEKFKASCVYPYSELPLEQREDLADLEVRYQQEGHEALAGRFARLVRACIKWDPPPITTFIACLEEE
jgi:serine/threonine protein kinase